MGRVPVRTEGVKVALTWVIVAAIVFAFARFVWWAARQPLIVLPALVVAAGWYAWYRLGETPAVLVGASIAVLLLIWRIGHPSSFYRLVWWRLRGMVRRAFIYNQEWAATCTNLSVTTPDPKYATGRNGEGPNRIAPPILRLRCTGTVDRLTVGLLPGQTLADFAKHADRFAVTFGATACRVRSIVRRDLRRFLATRLTRGGLLAGLVPAKAQKRVMAWARAYLERPAVIYTRRIELWFLVRDPLAAPVSLLAVPARTNFKALPVALREDGLIYVLRLLATHILVIGATGAGKGSVLWSIIRAIGPAIRSKVAELWVIDPKGGMEFAAGQRLFARYCYGDDTPENPDGAPGDAQRGARKTSYEVGFAVFLEEAVAIMRERQARLRGIARTHKPVPGDPLIVLLIDEIASLTSYMTDRDAKKRVDAALSLLLSQGRAVGVVVVGAGQDARKEVISLRGLFPTRLAMRLAEAEDVELVLGKGVHDRGARCEDIPLDMPGVTYVVEDGHPDPVRLRFAYVSDDEIADMSLRYAPGAPEPFDGPTNGPTDGTPGQLVPLPVNDTDDDLGVAA